MIRHDLALALDPALLMRRIGLEPDPWQAELLRSPGKQSLLLCTRQAGKSTSTASLAVHTALYQPGALVLLSPSLRQSQELLLKVSNFYAALGKPVAEREASALRLILANDSRIIVLPGSEATIRGFSGVSLLIIDEAPRVDDALYFSMCPMLAVSGGWLVALPTLFGKPGFFFDAWQNGGPSWKRTKINAYQCPRISEQFRDEERQALGSAGLPKNTCAASRRSKGQLFSAKSIDNACISDEEPFVFGRS